MEQLERVGILNMDTQYLAHPNTERDAGRIIQRRLEKLGVTVINPFARDQDDPDEWWTTTHSPEDARRVVERDLAWVRECDSVFAYVPSLVSCGTSMEIFYATKLLEKPVFIYTSPKYRFHPWLMYFGQVFSDLDFMFEVLEFRKNMKNVGFRIALTGRMGTGKSSVADFLVKSFQFKQYSFAAKLKEIASELFGMTVKDRNLLQALGMKIREMKQTAWVDYVMKQVESDAPLRTVVDDMRFLNEAVALEAAGFTLVRLYGNREGRKIAGRSSESENHISEVESDLIDTDYAIDTSGSLDVCYRKIVELLAELTK